MTKQQSKEMIDLYLQLSEEQRAKVFTAEQKACIDMMIFFDKLFTDPAFYKAVEQAVAETAYEELRQA